MSTQITILCWYGTGIELTHTFDNTYELTEFLLTEEDLESWEYVYYTDCVANKLPNYYE